MSRLIFTVISLFIIVRLYLVQGTEAGIAGFIGVAVLALMIRYADLWANTVLRVGFMQSKASDYKSAQNSVPALIFLAWIFLILFAILVALK